MLLEDEAVSEDEDNATTMPESADEVEAVDEADEEEQGSRDTAAAAAASEEELWPEKQTKCGENYTSGFSSCLPP